MGDLGEPNAHVELGSLPPFLQQSVNRWKKDTAAEDDWGPHPLDNLVGFAHAVQWTEPWIVGLLAMHAFLLGAAIVTRHSFEAQVGLFLLTLGLVASAEWLNAWGAAHWHEFASQDYFDEHGVFASVVFCTPLLVIATTIMILSLRSTVNMMVVTKRLELQHSLRAQEQQQRKASEGEAQQRQCDEINNEPTRKYAVRQGKVWEGWSEIAEKKMTTVGLFVCLSPGLWSGLCSYRPSLS